MGQFICLDCQALLDDPNKRVLGCANNRRFAKKRIPVNSR
jgi:DNA-directed RNA polymerase subunit RPC12/RpoP